MIYGRTGLPVKIARAATIADVEKLDGRKPDKRDREAIRCGCYLVCTYPDHPEAGERLYHIGFLKADRGAAEISEAIRALDEPAVDVDDKAPVSIPLELAIRLREHLAMLHSHRRGIMDGVRHKPMLKCECQIAEDYRKLKCITFGASCGASDDAIAEALSQGVDKP